MDKQTAAVRKRYDRVSALYDFLQAMMKKSRMAQWRRIIWEQARGKVLEVGVGTGENVRLYPRDADVTAIDFSEKMLDKAKKKAIGAGKRVDLRLMDAQNLEFEDEAFDTVITTCVFCSVPDPVKGMQEIKRVLKRDGRIIMLEHVRSNKPIIGLLMDFLNPIVVRTVGANINRNTVKNLRDAGLRIEVENDLMMDIVKHIICLRD